MERYDEGLRIIASAQEARDAGDHNTAHAKFLQGIEELMKLVQKESDEKTKALVRKHVARFMDEAELLEAYKMLRQESLGKQREWAGERALAMIEKAEHMQSLVRKISGARNSGGSSKGGEGEGGCEMGGASDASFDIIELPHAVGADGFDEEQAMPANFPQPERASTGVLPISLTWLFARGTKKSEAEEQVLILGNMIHGRRFDRCFETDCDPRCC